MVELQEVTLIKAPPHAVWAAIHNYAGRMQWDTMLRRVAVNGQDPGDECMTSVGTEITQWARWIAGGVRITVRYTQCTAPTADHNGVATIEMLQGPWFFRTFHARSELKVTDAGDTSCEGTYNFTCRPGWLRWIVEPAVTWMFKRETAARWKSLQGFLESSDAGPA